MESTNRTIFEEITGTVDEIIREVRKLIREGNARSLIIKNKEGRVLFQTHLTVGVAGTALFTVMAPFISALTMFVMFAKDVEVHVEKTKNGSSDGNANANDTHESRDEYEVEGEIIDIEEGEDEDEERS
ncbi:DUF4342 domain-containing protein [Rhodohalobacter sp. 8-1]|uniref:DUF4342 domain-containing protein n=1 Tax=Rhodohalobacter sp. 8-1 TaxID=3131972 RepID=UPI0030EB813F